MSIWVHLTLTSKELADSLVRFALVKAPCLNSELRTLNFFLVVAFGEGQRRRLLTDLGAAEVDIEGESIVILAMLIGKAHFPRSSEDGGEVKLIFVVTALCWAATAVARVEFSCPIGRDPVVEMGEVCIARIGDERGYKG